MQKETSFEICGFWYHIMWDGNIGHDSMGGKWTNQEKPTPEDPEFVNRVLDAYNEVKSCLNLN